jgi:Ca2+/Na+ antiporter
MTSKEINYTVLVVSIFAFLGLMFIMFFTSDARVVRDSYLMVLTFFLAILFFPFFLLKLFFYVNSHHNKNEELKLEDLPKDQDDIEHTH